MIQIDAAWAGVVLVLFLAVLAWVWKVQADINRIEKELAVNSAKDQAKDEAFKEIKLELVAIKAEIKDIFNKLSELKSNGK